MIAPTFALASTEHRSTSSVFLPFGVFSSSGPASAEPEPRLWCCGDESPLSVQERRGLGHRQHRQSALVDDSALGANSIASVDTGCSSHRGWQT